MATRKKTPTRGVAGDLQRTVARLRREGTRLAGGLERDLKALAKRARSEIVAEARVLQKGLGGRAATAMRSGRGAVESVERRLARVGEDLLKQLHAATRKDFAALERRVAQLERRNAELEERLVDLLPGTSRD
jgi:polyhydroxyalkanoate synthesis regulator phasin